MQVVAVICIIHLLEMNSSVGCWIIVEVIIMIYKIIYLNTHDNLTLTAPTATISP